MVGKVITFYSYKGGVGRSMALANIAYVLSKWGYKTLVIDWDLEAPGLENFYSELINPIEAREKKGLIDILNLKIEKPDIIIDSIPWHEFYTEIPIENKAVLHIMTAGKRDEKYVSKVKKFDFNSFYENEDGGEYLENLRDFWISKYDFVLIDSRTGLTDSSGICSIHMPDILVLLFTPNEQSFNGIKTVSEKAKKSHINLIYDRFKLRTLPIVSRIENAETNLLDTWINRIAEESNELLDWIPINIETKEYLITPLQLINQLKIPYKTFYSYGENLPVYKRGTSDPMDIGYVYETLAATLANNLENIYLLNDSRDNFIKKAKGDITEEIVLKEKIIQNEEIASQLKEEISETKEINSQLKEQIIEKESQQQKIFERRNKNKKIYIFLTILVIVIGSFVSFKVIKNNEIQEIKTDSLANVVKSIHYKSLADSLSQLNDSTKADGYYVKAADALLSNKDTTRAIKILNEALIYENKDKSLTTKKLDSLLKLKYDNPFKVDIFYRYDTNSQIKNNPSINDLTPIIIANQTLKSISKLENIIPRNRSISIEKQQHYKYNGTMNEIRYDNDEENIANEIAKQLNEINYFRKNNIFFKTVKMDKSASYNYISIFIQNEIK